MDSVTSTELNLVMVLFRGSVLIIAALAGAMSIFLGWKLYKDGMLSDVWGEASGVSGMKFKLVSAGPGIFFAGFGMALLMYLVFTQVKMTEEEVMEEQPIAQSQTRTTQDPSAFFGEGQLQLTYAVAYSCQNGFILAQARKPASPPPTRKCLVRRKTTLFLDGATLTAARVRRDAATARDVLLRTDRRSLTTEQRVALDDAVETLGVVLDGATDE